MMQLLSLLSAGFAGAMLGLVAGLLFNFLDAGVFGVFLFLIGGAVAGVVSALMKQYPLPPSK